MKKKSFIFIFSSFVIAGVGFYFYSKSSHIGKEHKVQKEANANNIEHTIQKDLAIDNHIAKDDKATKDRSIASIPTPTSKQVKKSNYLPLRREVVGASFNDQYSVSNKFNKNWKTLAHGHLNQQLKSVKKEEIKITPIKPVLYVKHGIGTNAEHVKISLKDERGRFSAYEAYIDSESGRIIQTWNRTHHEYRKTVKLNATGQEFFANKVNYKTN